MTTTSIFDKPFLETCDQIFIKPYRKGRESLEVAWYGKNVQYPVQTSEDVSICDRIQHAIMGFVLIIPLINAVVFPILKIFSEFLNTPVEDSSDRNVKVNTEVETSSPVDPLFQVADKAFRKGNTLTFYVNRPRSEYFKNLFINPPEHPLVLDLQMREHCLSNVIKKVEGVLDYYFYDSSEQPCYVDKSFSRKWAFTYKNEFPNLELEKAFCIVDKSTDTELASPVTLPNGLAWGEDLAPLIADKISSICYLVP